MVCLSVGKPGIAKEGIRISRGCYLDSTETPFPALLRLDRLAQLPLPDLAIRQGISRSLTALWVWESLFQRGYPLLNGELDEAGNIADVQFLHQAAAVGLDSLRGEE